MSWLGRSLLPAVRGIIRDYLGGIREPDSPAQLASWLRTGGCEEEARYAENMAPGTFRLLLDRVRELP